jgi:hypothetical protein
MAMLRDRRTPEYDPRARGYVLPPMTLNVDDVRDIVAFIERESEGLPVALRDNDDMECALTTLGDLNDHQLARLTIAVQANTAQAESAVVVLFAKTGSSVVTTGTVAPTPMGESVSARIVEISRGRRGVRRLLWSVYGVFALAVVGLSVWYAVDVGLDWRLIPPGAAALAGALYAAFVFTERLAARVVFRFTGTKIDPISRKDFRQHRRDTLRDWKVGVPTGVVVGAIGTVFGYLLGQ